MTVSFCHQVRAVVCSADKQSQLAWLLRVVLQTVKQASQEGQLFAYVPNFYLDSLIEICAALRTYVHPAAPLENIEGTMLPMYICVFLCVCVHTCNCEWVYVGM